jgi:hypothetical protein
MPKPDPNANSGPGYEPYSGPRAPSKSRGFEPTGPDMWGRGSAYVGPMGQPDEPPNAWFGDGGASFGGADVVPRRIPRGNGGSR